MEQIKEKSPNLYQKVSSTFKAYLSALNDEELRRSGLLGVPDDTTPLIRVSSSDSTANKGGRASRQNKNESIEATLVNLEKTLQMLRLQINSDSAL